MSNQNDNSNDQKLISTTSCSSLSLPDRILLSNSNLQNSGLRSSWCSTSSSSSSTKSSQPEMAKKIIEPSSSSSSSPAMNENFEIFIHQMNNDNNNFCNNLHSKNDCIGGGGSASIDRIKQNKYIEISRNVLQMHSLVDEKVKTMNNYDNEFGKQQHQDSSILLRMKKIISIENFNSDYCRRCSPINSIRSHIPIVEWLPKYQWRSYLCPDIIAGITISILHIPQGIAYSMLAGLPPVHGLYVSFFPVLIYALLGTSPHISIGTFAIASIMLNNIAMKIGAKFDNNDNILPKNDTMMITMTPTQSSLATVNTPMMMMMMNNNNNQPTTLEILTSVCILCGIIQIIMALMRLGSLSLILSEQLVSAFSTAVAFHVATSQLSSIFGYNNLTLAKSGPLKLIKTWIILAKHYDQINLYCLIFSIISITILIISKELLESRLKHFTSFPLPIDLILVITTILLSWLFQFNHQFDIQVVKNVPTGLPKPTVPRFDLIPNIFFDSLILSIICFAVSLSLAKIFAKKHGHHIRPNQELFALGTANIFSSFFLAYPCSAALSRSTLQEKIGGKTQIAGIISSIIILTVLLFLAPFLYHLPKFTLSCIVLVALKSMFLQISDVKIFWLISRLDGAAWIITFLSVIILDIDYGLIIGIISSILVILIKLTFPRISILGHLVSTEIYLEKDSYNNLLEYPSVKIYRFCSPLFYLNVDSFKEKIIDSLINNNDDDDDDCHDFKALILDFGGMPFIDKTGIDMLIEVIKSLQTKQIQTCLANCPHHIIHTLKTGDFFTKIQKHSKYSCKLYPTIHDAVINYW
ncbi:solute carrier family 26 member 10-like [Dermatophagoides pteronyssinus]|uniref:solute carrier family 26 member 10-like n=1 Tax=Dermatophagoides pteronyssinus TaxID=6956 RepID=UPI003F667D44